MILIATDEAGYGPKLGPLVVTATMWNIDRETGHDDLGRQFSALSSPVSCQGPNGKPTKIKIDDSKAVFKPTSARPASQSIAQANSDNPTQDAAIPQGLFKLLAVTQTAGDWINQQSNPPVDDSLNPFSMNCSPADLDALASTPWLSTLNNEATIPCVSPLARETLLQAWGTGDVKLLAVKSRVITAQSFNELCDSGMNKADLLASSTLALVRQMLEDSHSQSTLAVSDCISVYCDRFGGRRYYAGPLQMAFDGQLVQVIDETSGESHYRVPFQKTPFEIRFTVKGDRFTPVAFSSMIAKCMRELAMESMNEYFATEYSKLHPGKPLKPTAGYPVDADRFLKAIQPVIERDNLSAFELIRQR
ncbi:Hypothetical protein SV7mr_13080 [Stieleria bergensis]|uniref:Uncharacterized protein n=1 Tax=Stieleria bergensis TaxID=2528025 RepID=A0A517SRQ5_9BACT|nr:Hypothetical protein SV7mr_13080 [Planctomycetes bacterium SV_7m_r]